MRITKTSPCYIIAEIGGNFTTWEEAKRLVDDAQACGVDAVKLQTYRADTVASRKAVFDMENTGVVSQHELFKKYEIGEALHRKVFEYARSRGLDCFSTPSHESDLELLEKLGVDLHKIGSDDAVNLPFLRSVARTGKPIILSTGMCTLDEVRESVEAIRGAGNKELVLLHAITSYPTHAPDVNLLAMTALQRAFPDVPVGYSDHTLSSTACLAAVALGAKVIEKHFTFDKKAEGPDHVLSADPAEMKALVLAVRELEVMLGDGVKKPAAGEAKTRKNNRKSLIVARPVKKGQALGPSDLAIKRPGWGLAPKLLDSVVGRKAARDLEADEVLKWDDLQNG